MRKQRNNQPAQRRTKGFTLIEMLVVTAMIVLLVSIIVPAVGRAMLLSKVAASRARIHSLAAACQNYFDDTGRRYFPGQTSPSLDWLTGSAVPPGGNNDLKTGSGVLALALFNPKNGSFTDRAGLRSTNAGYIAYADDWFVKSPANDSLIIADAVGDGKAIVYYPSRIGQTGYDSTNHVFYAFSYGDNSSLTGSDITTFTSYINDLKFGSAAAPANPYNESTFLLMAPGTVFDPANGASRTYFNNGDPSNF